jgi:hypothetical protein
VEDIDFWVDFVFGNSKKIVFGRKNQSSPQFVHIAESRKKLILKMGKIKNVHTWPLWTMDVHGLFIGCLAFEESFFLKLPFKILGLACNIWLVSIDGQICVPVLKFSYILLSQHFHGTWWSFEDFKMGVIGGALFHYHFQSWKTNLIDLQLYLDLKI